jgi:N-succinyl-L-ornithine transcarbamylase
LGATLNAPQAVANTVEMMRLQNADFVITHQRLQLNPEITKNSLSDTKDQDKAFENADFIYTKKTGAVTAIMEKPPKESNWTVTAEKNDKTMPSGQDVMSDGKNSSSSNR